jgi:AraC-like DNA-binding protein
MNRAVTSRMESIISNVQVDLLVAAQIKVPLNWHSPGYMPNCDKLYYIMEGEGYIESNGKLYTPTAGQFCLLPSGKWQKFGISNPQSTYRKYWCHFNASIGNIPLFDIIHTPLCFELPEDKKEPLKQQFEELIKLHRTGGGITGEIRIRALLMQIICTFIECSPVVTFQSKLNANFEKMNIVINYMNNYLAQSPTIKQLSDIAHFHPNYFIRVFRETVGFTPVQYMNKLRLERAKHQLIFSDTTIHHIAESLGLEFSYFSKFFKEQTGLSPSEFRENFAEINPTSIHLEQR